MPNKKTIFFIINSMEGGGAERVLSNILPSLSKKYTVYLLLLKDSRFYNIPKNIHIISFSKIKNNFLMILLFPFYIWKLKKLIKKYQPYKTISFLEIANFVNILSHKKAIISFRITLSFFENTLFGKLYLVIIKKLYPKAKFIIVNSEENKFDLAKRLNIPLNKITTIYNPIDLKQIENLKNKSPKLPFTRKDKQKIFITIGRLDKQKNISTLIKTFKNLSPENILLIIGGGPERLNLANLIKQYNLTEQIFLLGRQKNVYSYLNMADYFIFASQVEGFPNVLIEAMACNLPIITTDFKTGAREIIDPKLNFNQKINYPYFGPNGVLLSLSKFNKDFQKINFNNLQQKQIGIEKFELRKISQDWKKVID